MTVADNTRRILDWQVAYDKQKPAILGDKTRTGDYKAQAFQTFYVGQIPTAEALVRSQWGEIVETEGGQWMLSDSGAVWSALMAAEKRVQETLSIASAPSGDSVFNQGRVRTIMVTEGSPENIAAYYEKRASSHERMAMQDFLAGMVTGSSVEWNHLIKLLSNDRIARIHSPAVQAAETALNQLMADVEEAWKVTQTLIHEFGRNSAYLNRLPNLIYIGKKNEVRSGQLMQTTEIDRRPWGVIVKGGQYVSDNMLGSGN